MQKFLNPKNDFAFKKVFGTEKNKDILIKLLNEVLKKQLHKSIIDVTFLSPFLEPDALARKQSIVDVLCKDEDGCTYIIEMQVAKSKGFEKRAQYYASKAFISQMNVGDKYQNLKEVIFIAFTDFSVFPNKKSYKSEHKTLDNKTYENDLDKISFTFIDLVKFQKSIQSKNLENLNLEEKFYYFLCHAEDIKPYDLQKLIGKDKIINKAFEELEGYYWSKEEIAKYEAELKRERDNQAVEDNIRDEATEKGMQRGLIKGMEKGMEKGLIKGIQQGLKESKLDIAKKMLKENLPKSLISKLINLSEEEIKSIIQKINEL